MCVCVCVYVCSSTQNVRFESITVENCNFFAVKMLTFIQRKRDFHLQMEHRLHLLYNMGVENAGVEFAALKLLTKSRYKIYKSTQRRNAAALYCF